MQSSNLGVLTQELMSAPMPTTAGDVDEIVRAAGWKATGATVLLCTLWKKAVTGDVNAAKLIREMNGEATAESKSFDFSLLSDADLMRLLDSDEADPSILDENNASSDVYFDSPSSPVSSVSSSVSPVPSQLPPTASTRRAAAPW